MSCVMVRRFPGDRIVMMADTMVSYGPSLRSTAIPGQLKVIVLSIDTSIGYAGHVATSIDSIRTAKAALDAGGSPEELIETLRRSSEGGECDFLYVSHRNGGLKIVKIGSGKLFTGSDRYWIGDSCAVTASISAEDEYLRIFSEQTSEFSDDAFQEMASEAGFLKLFESPRFSSTVGGLPTILKATRYGHGYGMFAKIVGEGTIYGGDVRHPDDARNFGSYQYSVESVSRYRGVGIMGMYIQEAGTGYVYDPLHRNDAVTLKVDQLRFHDHVGSLQRLHAGTAEGDVEALYELSL